MGRETIEYGPCVCGDAECLTPIVKAEKLDVALKEALEALEKAWYSLACLEGQSPTVGQDVFDGIERVLNIHAPGWRGGRGRN